jgi:hypothetical protein
MDEAARPRVKAHTKTVPKGEIMLKSVFVAACLAAPLATLAADAQTAQQTKMTTCNKEAGAKKLEGDARKKFMSECLSASGAPATAKPKMTQQEKMGYCNKEAGAKKLEGDARKKFMSECLSG